MEQIHNIYITSTNKTGNDTNYNYNLYFSNYGISILPDEEAYLNITSFQSLNSFYNINDNSKKFTIITKTALNVYFTYSFELDTGNYDIYNFMTSVNNLCNNFFTMSYNEKKNKWNYTSNQANLNVYLIPSIYNSKYFGLTPNINNEILPSINGIGTYSNIINMNNFSLIVIKILGLVEKNKTIDNFNNNILNRGDIVCLVNRQDTSIGALINWTDLNKSFIKKINNIEINSLTFKFTNEFNELLTDLNDWLITLQITIKKKQYPH